MTCMDSDIKLRINLGLTLVTLILCIVGFFIENWGKGDPPSQFEDTPIPKGEIRNFDYDKLGSVGILRSCVYKTCISNVVDGDSKWRTIVPIGSLSIVCFVLSSGCNGVQLCSEYSTTKYLVLAVHLSGVILYTTMIVLFHMTTEGITLDVGFYVAVFADIFAIVTWLSMFSAIFRRNNRVQAIST